MLNLTRTDLANLSVILLVSSVVRLYQLGDASLWLDEALTLRIVNYPLSTLWVTPYDPTPPLYYTVIKIMSAFGTSEWVMRFPSAVFGVLTSIVMYIATRKLAGSLAAFTASMILVLSWFNIEYSQEARAYALLSLCLAMAFLGLVNIYQRWNRSIAGFTITEFLRTGALLYALGMLAALYTHNTAVFFWIGVQFFFFALWAKPFGFSWNCLAGWFVVNLAVLVLWTPWLIASLSIIESGGISWLQNFDLGRAFVMWTRVHGMFGSSHAQLYLSAGLLMAAILGVYALRDRLVLAALLLGLLVSSSLFIWLYGYVSTPVYLERTILWGSLFSSVLIGIGVSRLPRYFAWAAMAVILVCGARIAYLYHDGGAGEYQDWRSAAAVINESQSTSDIIVFRSPSLIWPFLYYIEDLSDDLPVYGWDCANERPFAGEIETSRSILTRVKWTSQGARLDNIVADTPDARLWIVHAHCQLKDEAKANGLFAEHWRLKEVHQFKGAALYELVPAGWRGTSS